MVNRTFNFYIFTLIFCFSILFSTKSVNSEEQYNTYVEMKNSKNNQGFDLTASACAPSIAGVDIEKCSWTYGNSKELTGYDVYLSAMSECMEKNNIACLLEFYNDQDFKIKASIDRYFLAAKLLNEAVPNSVSFAAEGWTGMAWGFCGNVTIHDKKLVSEEEGKEQAKQICLDYGYTNPRIAYRNNKKIGSNYSNEENQVKKEHPKNLNQIFSIGIGTGFFINSSGNFVTNSHVVDGECINYKIRHDLQLKEVKIIANDPVNDIAVGKIELNSKNNFLELSKSIKLGEEIVIGGYPLSLVLRSDTLKVNKGIVSSLSGINNNFSEIQIDAPVQPGNSGGPIVNMYGNVVGVTTSQLTEAQNINFGKKSDILALFLKSNAIRFSESISNNIKKTEEIAGQLDKSTIQIFCSNTGEKWIELLKDEKVPKEVSELIN